MRFAILILLLTFAGAILFAVIQLLLHFGGGGDIGGSFNAGTDSGMYRSIDGGVSFVQSAKVNEKINFSRFDILDLKEDSAAAGTWWVATEGEGIFRSPNQGETWETVWGEGDALKQAVVRSLAQASPNIWLFSLDAGKRGRIWKTVDNGKTFREVYSAAKDSVYITSLAIPRQDAHVVLAGLSDGLLIGSIDGGESWTSLKQFSGSVGQLLFAPSDPNIVYAAVDRVGPMRSTDRGASWTDLNQQTILEGILPGSATNTLPNFPGGNQVFRIAVHPQDANRLLFATLAGLLSSADGGRLFGKLQVPLSSPAVPIRSVAYDPGDPNILYVTAGDGFYTSVNNGESWTPTRFTIRSKLTLIGVSAADRNSILVGTNN